MKRLIYCTRIDVTLLVVPPLRSSSSSNRGRLIFQSPKEMSCPDFLWRPTAHPSLNSRMSSVSLASLLLHEATLRVAIIVRPLDLRSDVRPSDRPTSDLPIRSRLDIFPRLLRASSSVEFLSSYQLIPTFVVCCSLSVVHYSCIYTCLSYWTIRSRSCPFPSSQSPARRSFPSPLVPSVHL